jgi:ubiquitin carboxyl-terminal hydrolase 36/42
VISVLDLSTLQFYVFNKKYRCKKHVNAKKHFTIHQAPNVLTIHLKRFSPFGTKIGHPLSYDETITLKNYMSEDQHGPSYSLYGVICHAGGGPNSGHYYAFTKDRNNRWHEMNDESVSPLRDAPTRLKNAYILFYIQNKGTRLETAVNSRIPVLSSPKPHQNSGIVAGMKKRKVSEDDEDQGVKITQPFIGPILPPNHSSALPQPPSPIKRQKTTDGDPQAEVIKRKIAQISPTLASNALSSLGDYHSEPSDDGKTQTLSAINSSPPKTSSPAPSSPIQPHHSSQTPNKPNPIPAEQFYSSVSKKGPNWMNRKSGMNPLGGGRLMSRKGSPMKKRIRPV